MVVELVRRCGAAEVARFHQAQLARQSARRIDPLAVRVAVKADERRRLLYRAPRRDLAGRCRDWLDVCSAEAPGHEEEAVSYTHLRAHETSAHL
eukprot:5478519-Alexandrium_andersonii.AAC.1